MSRLSDVQRFYGLLDRLTQRVGGTRTLAECHGRLGWPERGIYFFYEPGQNRSDSGEGPSIARIGTHPRPPGMSRAASATACTGGSYHMEIRGLEPLTYTLRTYRSPS